MAEWSNAPDLKSDEFKIPWVQIPLSPYKLFITLYYTLNYFYVLLIF